MAAPQVDMNEVERVYRELGIGDEAKRKAVLQRIEEYCTYSTAEDCTLGTIVPSGVMDAKLASNPG